MTACLGRDTLVADLKEVSNFFGGLCIEHVVARGTAEREDELKVGLLVAPAPLKVGLHISQAGSGCSAINDIP